MPILHSLKQLLGLVKARAALCGSVLLLVVASVALLGAGRHESAAFARTPGQSHPVLSAGAAQHGPEALGQRAQPLLVAATPLIERAAAIPALPARLSAARVKASARESQGSTSQIEVAVVRWRRHAPRMDSGDPPRRTSFAA